MNWKAFIRGLLVSSIIFGGMILFLTFAVPPERGAVTVGIYLFSVFFFIFGILTIISFYMRRWWMHNEILFTNVKVSIRQSFLFSAFVTSVLLLAALRLLTWWDAIILAVSFVLIELYFKMRS